MFSINKKILRLSDKGIKKTIKEKLRHYLSKYLIKIARYKKIQLPDSQKFNKIIIDTSNYYSLMCDLSIKYNTDKSPYNQNSFRHAYTGIYHFLFKKISNDHLKISEIGILKNESIKLLREYFKNSEIFAFDNEPELLNKAIKDNLKNVNYNLINVKNAKNIVDTFSKLETKFDIIIDDSTHVFDDQIRLITCLHKFLKPGGTLVVEDIYAENEESNYYKALAEHKFFFEDIYFIETKHRNVFTPLWNNNKILILEKKSTYI